MKLMLLHGRVPFNDDPESHRRPFGVALLALLWIGLLAGLMAMVIVAVFAQTADTTVGVGGFRAALKPCLEAVVGAPTFETVFPENSMRGSST